MFGFNEKIEKVYLDPDIDYVFCFLKETVIEEKNCDYYEHNLECDRKHDVFGRTHRKGSLAGYCERGRPGSILNSCKYCLKKDKAKEYLLPSDAIELFNNHEKIETFIDKVRKMRRCNIR